MTVQIERALQREIVVRLRAGGWPVLALPIPNSIYFPARNDAERSLIARVISQMKKSGMLLPGAPDLVLLWAGGGAMVELKRPPTRTLLGKRAGGRPTTAQADLAKRAAELGIHHAYVTSWDDLAERLAAWGVNHNRAADAMFGGVAA